MITEALLRFFHGLVSILLDALEVMLPSPPGFWSDATAYIDTVFAGALAPVRYFLPIGPSMAIAAVLLAILVVSMGLKLLRLALSVMTGGGGGIG